MRREQPLISKKKWTLSLKFRLSVKFLVPRSGPVRYQKPVKHLHRLCFGPLNPPSPPKSHRKRNERQRRGKIFFYFYQTFEINANENETSSELGSYCIKHILPVGSLFSAPNLHRAEILIELRRGGYFRPFSKLTLKKFQRLETRKTSFDFHRKFYFNAEQNEAASEPKPCSQYWSLIDVKIKWNLNRGVQTIYGNIMRFMFKAKYWG